MAETYDIDPRRFWETVAVFADFDYSFPPYFYPSLTATPAYPNAVLTVAQSAKALGLQGMANADALAPTNYRRHKYTNCCMFVEAALMGGALRTDAGVGAAWDKRMHAWAMNNDDGATGNYGPPRAYVAAGLADPIDIAATPKLEPGEIYVIQGAHHNWLIVDYDEDDDTCLRLEANLAGKARPEFATVPAGCTGPFYGGVAFAGIARVGAERPDRDAWRAALPRDARRRAAFSWATYRAELLAELALPAHRRYVGMARMHMRRIAAGPWIPVVYRDGDRPVKPDVALATAWAGALAADAPFPVGSNRAWHDGIHLPAAPRTPIVPFAAGQLVSARFPAPTAEGLDGGAVIVRHRFDPSRLGFLGLEDAHVDGEVEFFSAIVHLAGGEAGTTPLLDSLYPIGNKPSAVLRTDAKLDVVVYDDAGTPRALAAEAWDNVTERLLDRAAPITGLAGDRRAIELLEGERHAEVWSLAPPSSIPAPEGAHFGLHRAGDGAVLELAAAWADPVTMAYAIGADGSWSLDVRAEQDDVHWVAAAAPVPAVTAKPVCLHGPAERRAMTAAGADVLVARGGAARIEIDGGATPVAGVITLAKSKVIALAAPAAGEWASTRWRVCVRAPKPGVAKPPPTAVLLQLDDGKFLETTAKLDPSAIALGDAVPARAGFVYVPAAHVRLSSKAGCAHPADEIAAFARHPADAIIGTFVGDGGVALVIGKQSLRTRASRLHAACDAKGRLALAPCVGIDDDALADVLAELGATRRRAGADTAARLAAGHSRLVALPLDAKGYGVGAKLEIVAPSPAAPLVLHPELTKDKRGWWYDDKVSVSLPAPPADLKWSALAVIRGPGKDPPSAAIVEIVLAAPPSRFDDAPIRRHGARVDYRKQVVAKLVAGWVDFAAIERDDPEYDAAAKRPRWRTIECQPIGTAGHTAPARQGATGIHVEVFAATHVLGNGIANGRWREIGADISAAPRTAAFERELLALLGEGMLGQSRTGKALREEIDRGARRPETWSAFCNDPANAPQLAELVAVHEPEWTVAWTDSVVARDQGGPGLAHAPLDEPWPRNAAALGLPQGKLRFYHPLRLLEWLTTGVEVHVRPLDRSAPDFRANVEIGDTSTALVHASGNGDQVLVQRALLGRAVPTATPPQVPATLVVEGGSNPIPDVPLTLQRGRVVKVTLCEPGVTVLRSATITGTGDDPFVFADASARFADAKSSACVVAISLHFDRSAPSKVEISLGGSDFVLGAVLGDDYQATTDGPRRKVLAPREATPAQVPSERHVALYVSVTALSKVDASDEITIEVSGGDLAAAHRETLPIRTRTLGKAEDHGRDVHKLQVYLSRIEAMGMPCLRVQKRDKSWVTTSPDGGFGAATTSALWRFVLTYGGRTGWARSLTQVAAQRKAYAIPAGGWTPPAPVANKPPVTPGEALEAAVAELAKDCGRPFVDAALIAELVRLAVMPNVLPHLGITADVPTVPAEVASQPKLAGLSMTARTRLLPAPEVLDDHQVVLRVSSDGTAGDPAGLSVTIEITGDSVALVGTATRTLAELLAHGITLVPTGTIDGKAPVVTLSHGGSELGSTTLAIAVDLLDAKAAGPGTDAVIVQTWLCRWHDKAGKPYATGVDGVWGDGSRARLIRFRNEQLGKQASYAEVLALLAQPQPEATEEP